MKKLVILLLALALWADLVYAGGKERWENLIKKSVDVLDDMNNMPDNAIPIYLIEKCRAIAIFPGTVSGGFVIGGKFGQGVLLAKNENKWSSPAVFNIVGGSFGWQIGGKATDIILVIMGNESLDRFLRGKVILGAGAAATAGPLGRNAQVGTDIQFKSGILAYSRARGLFVGLKLEGCVITENKNANEFLYKKPLSAKEILIESKAEPTRQGRELIAKLRAYGK